MPSDSYLLDMDKQNQKRKEHVGTRGKAMVCLKLEAKLQVIYRVQVARGLRFWVSLFL